MKPSLHTDFLKGTMRQARDYTGEKRGRLTVIKIYSHNKVKWLCRCDCGKETLVWASNLKRTKSCGCLIKETASKRFKKHGLAKTPEHIAWAAMRQRCLFKGHKNYHNYGGRGILICKEWDLFENFLSDMGKRPSPDHSLERINNELGYSKENCKWATRLEQGQNTRRVKLIKFNGEVKTIREWAEFLGIKHDTLSCRLRTMSVEKSLTKKGRS